MLRRNAWLLAAACVFGSARAAGDLAGAVRLDEPRAFGHFLGDELTRTISLTVPLEYLLDPASLPKSQRLTRYFEVIASHVTAQAAADGRRYEIRIDYQIVNSPEKVEMEMLPGVDLHFTAGAAPAAASFDTQWQAAPVLIAPLTSLETRAGLEQLRPSRLPQSIATTRQRALLGYFAAAAALLSLPAIAHFYARAGRGARAAPFARALRRLRAARAGGTGPATLQDAYRILHRAFDETADARVFADQLPAFFAAHARFEALAPRVQQFFAASRAEFFAAAGDESFGLEAVTTLCAELRDREGPARA